MTAHCNRVAVEDGHTESVSVKLKKKASAEEIIAAFNEFRSTPQELKLPLAPAQPVVYDAAPDRPQPRFDVDRGNGMTVSVGRLRPCGVLDWKFTVLSHNTIRGAAGAALLNAELLKVQGLPARESRAAPRCRGSGCSAVIVMKFGGTSVEDATAIDRVASIVKSRLPERPVRRGQRHGEGHRPAAGHGGRGRARRSRSSARNLPQPARAPLPHRRRVAGHRPAHRTAQRTGRGVRFARRVAARHLRRRRTDAAHLRLRRLVRRAAVQHDRRCPRFSRATSPPCWSIRARSSSPMRSTAAPCRKWRRSTTACKITCSR